MNLLRLPLVVLCCCLAAAAAAAPASDAERLSMTPISLSPDNGGSAAERFSGYFKLNRTYDAHMFFFYFEAREEPDTAPVVLWMTGGPGCSSELAVFFEMGPWEINPDGKTLTETKFGWDVRHHMIFIDQPVNTGFSYSADDRDRCYSEACVSDDVLDFLSEFFRVRRELQGREFFVTGESYAGHYVPAVASRVFHASKSGEVVPPINLQGLAIGNGLTDPAIQYGAYSDYALMRGLIGQTLHDRLKMLYPACRLALEVCDGLDFAFECEGAVEFCQLTQFAPIMMYNEGMNVYDVRRKCEGPLCYRRFEVLDDYLNRPAVRAALGVGNRTWAACNMGVHADMLSDWGHNFDGVLPELLAAGVRVMIYAGVEDFICNWVGNKQWVDVLPWHGAAQWGQAPERSWTVEGEAAGTVQAVGPLSFVKVEGAGHMAPMDMPSHSLDMITRFTRNQPLHAAEDTDGDGSTAQALATAAVKQHPLQRQQRGGQVLLPGATRHQQQQQQPRKALVERRQQRSEQ